MGYFRALFQKNEMSFRAYELTKEVIMMNPGNYTAWFYRRKLIDELKLPLDKEMEFLNSVGIKLEKNY
jgi:protein farnesyltransferase/geranylgeranyltransferase type-1 subunit alpha